MSGQGVAYGRTDDLAVRTGRREASIARRHSKSIIACQSAGAAPQGSMSGDRPPGAASMRSCRSLARVPTESCGARWTDEPKRQSPPVRGSVHATATLHVYNANFSIRPLPVRRWSTLRFPQDAFQNSTDAHALRSDVPVMKRRGTAGVRRAQGRQRPRHLPDL